jgi:hypothetical protein
MKIKRTESIWEYKIIRGIEAPSPNPVATETEAFHHITVAEYRSMSEVELKELFSHYIIYADPGTDGVFVQDDEAEEILSKLASLNKNEKLLDSLELFLTGGVWNSGIRRARFGTNKRLSKLALCRQRGLFFRMILQRNTAGKSRHRRKWTG